MQRVGMRVRSVKPASVAEAGGLDNERVALPFRHGVAEPCGIGINRELSAIVENLAVLIEFLTENYRFYRSLDYLKRVTRAYDHRVGSSVGQAAHLRFIATEVIGTFLINC